MSRGIVAVVLLLLSAACRPATPSPRAWDSAAEQAVSDMVSEVATTRLVVSRVLRGDFVGHYGSVLLTYSEEAAGAAADRMSTVQPPPERRGLDHDLGDVLSAATDDVSDARRAVTAADDAGLRSIDERLRRVEENLAVLEERLESAR